MINFHFLGGFAILAPIVSIIRDVAIIAVAVKGIQALNTYINKNSF